MRQSDFIELLRGSDDLTKRKLECILSEKTLKFIYSTTLNIDFLLLKLCPIELLPKLPKFGVNLNATMNHETILTHLCPTEPHSKTDQLYLRVEALLALGADPTIKNGAGKTAVDLALADGLLRPLLEQAAQKIEKGKK